jgi:hypothetical protein
MREAVESAAIVKAASTKSYSDMISATKSVPLIALVRSREGAELLQDMCMLVDVNQQYADLLPQWKDLAHELDVDALRTKWVEVCVRPKEGLTRAVLEIYIADGGTLGDVLRALQQLECLQILEKLRHRVWAFLDAKDKEEAQLNDLEDPKRQAHFFSILATLASTIGKEDPCFVLQKFAEGLRKGTSCGQEAERTHDVLVRGGGFIANKDAVVPRAIFDPNLHSEKNEKHSMKTTEGGNVCKILMLFADDGMQYANQAAQLIQGLTHEVHSSISFLVCFTLNLMFIFISGGSSRSISLKRGFDVVRSSGQSRSMLHEVDSRG